MAQRVMHFTTPANRPMKHLPRLLLVPFLFLVPLLITAGCSEESKPTRPADPVPVRIVITPPSGLLAGTDQIMRLNATLYDASGNTLTGTGITWSSSNSAVASVSNDGVVVARSAGTTQITAAAGGLRASITVTVARTPSRVVVTPESARLAGEGETLRLVAVVLDADGGEITDAPRSWRSEHPMVASVDDQGEVTARTEGETRITVSTGDLSASVTVTVDFKTPANRIVVSPESVNFTSIGETAQLSARVLDPHDQEIQDPDVTWASEDKAVATVDDQGVVTARMEGVKRVTATYGSLSDHVMVIVGTPTTLVVTTKSVRLTAIGETVYPDVKLLDAYGMEIVGPGRALVWTSEDPAVATVDDSGGITAQLNGQTIVTVTSKDMSDSISVTVAQEADHMVLTPGSVQLSAVGETIQLSADVFDANDYRISGAEVTWSSDDPSVASVDDHGLVTAHKAGETELTVSSDSASTTVVVSIGEVSSDRSALVHFYHATDGPNWKNNTNWLTDEPLEKWHGISVNSAGHVERIWLFGNDLKGDIPGSLASLPHLKVLALSDSLLTGTIPAELGDLASLERIILTFSKISGSIPSSLSNLSKLKVLDLQYNQLTGGIPSSLDNLSDLAYLRLTGNPLGGSIPSSLGRLDKLQRLYLSGTGLTGSIPSSFGGLTSLIELYMAGNSLTGSIPKELGTLKRFISLRVTDNAGLTGPLPRTFLDLEMQALYLFGTQVCIPRDLEFEEWQFSFYTRYAMNCKAGPDLAALESMYNWMGGKNWAENTNWRSAKRFSEWYGVSVNSSGRVSRVELPGNKLTGGIQIALGGLAELRRLDLANNSLSGGIPAELGGLSKLLLLNLHNNEDMSGPLPAALTGMTSLGTLWLGGTGLCVPRTAAFQTWLDGIATKEYEYCEAGN